MNVGDGSYKNLDMRTEEKGLVPDFIELILITRHPQSFFVGHRYMQRAGTAWSGTPSTFHQMYLIPYCYEMDAVSFAYGWSSRKAREPRKALSTILNVPTTAVFLEPSITVHQNCGAGIDTGYLVSTPKRANNGRS